MSKTTNFPRRLKSILIIYGIVLVLTIISMIIKSSFQYGEVIFLAFSGIFLSLFFFVGFYRWKYIPLYIKAISLLVGIVLSIILLSKDVNYLKTHENYTPFEEYCVIVSFSIPIVGFISSGLMRLIRSRYKKYCQVTIIAPLIFMTVMSLISALFISNIIGYIFTVAGSILSWYLGFVILGAVHEDISAEYDNYLTVVGSGQKYYHKYDNVYSDNNGHYYEKRNGYLYPKDRI